MSVYPILSKNLKCNSSLVANLRQLWHRSNDKVLLALSVCVGWMQMKWKKCFQLRMTTIPGCAWMRVENSHSFLQITSQVLIVSFEVSRARIINRVSQALQFSLTMLHRPGHHQALYFILKNREGMVYKLTKCNKVAPSHGWSCL